MGNATLLLNKSVIPFGKSAILGLQESKFVGLFSKTNHK
jgi:hypothetical protein